MDPTDPRRCTPPRTRSNRRRLPDARRHRIDVRTASPEDIDARAERPVVGDARGLGAAAPVRAAPAPGTSLRRYPRSMAVQLPPVDPELVEAAGRLDIAAATARHQELAAA